MGFLFLLLKSNLSLIILTRIYRLNNYYFNLYHQLLSIDLYLQQKFQYENTFHKVKHLKFFIKLISLDFNLKNQINNILLNKVLLLKII